MCLLCGLVVLQHWLLPSSISVNEFLQLLNLVAFQLMPLLAHALFDHILGVV